MTQSFILGFTTAITIWGTHDGASWLQSSSDVGGGADGNRPQMPLLFDDEYKAKPAYWGIVDSSKLEPLINRISIRYSESDDFENIDPVIYQSYVGEISFRALWNESGIKIMVNVPDREKDDLDRVVIYAESPENVFTVSMLPWITFDGFNLNIKSFDYLLPIFTVGRYEQVNGKYIIPLAVQVHHAVCDGYHASCFITDLQKEIDCFV